MMKLARTCLVATALLAPLPAAAVDSPAYLPPSAAPVAGPAPVAPALACYAVFFMYEDGRGPSVVRRGPEEIPAMRQLAYPGGPTLNSNVMSVTTSPGAVVQLYSGRQFRRPMMKVGPESTVNLARPRANSYTIDCVTPIPVAPPPGALRN